MKNILLISLSIMISASFNACNNNKTTEATYEGEDISGIAEITRDKNTKAASIRIDTDGRWKLYAGPKVESIDFSKPVLEKQGKGDFAIPVPDSVRSYFQLVTDGGKAILAENHLPMTGGFNFRDLGGIKTKDGHFVKWGKIFRSDDLHNLTDADLNYLASIPLISIVDFRSESEVSQLPDKVPSSVVKDYPYHITPGNLTASSDLSQFNVSDMDSVMMSINKLLVTDSTAIKRYKDFFALLQNEKDVPLMFHCTAGKDRTGMGAALVLFALGVDEDTIMDDHLLSNIYLKDKYAKYVAQYPELEPLFGVKSQYLQAGINEIKETYGSIDNYLENTLAVDIPRFREMYLY